ncbi:MULTISPECIES: hypothetical protein [Haloferax]|uniref:Uncharacterized protein n=1 Tax=Haloferax marinum TaxID=2666143 RepID=A0A6A8G6R1_9EURY|nr:MULTISPECIES: hypothetical protein [Haloferax]KAB1197896.1 hypothetical protein Hfx1150_10355 [Haloferax sp. CBA1150]MRW96960.1 hypothetical protein [Haloferax marinum]
MPEQLPSDHPSVQTFRAHIARSGGTRRPCLRVPDDVPAEEGDFIRLHLDGTAYHARLASDASGFVIRGAYDNKRLARTAGEGENRLVEWCRENDRGPDDAVEFDDLDGGYQFGLRVPGVRTVYRITERPNDSLSSIAEKFGLSDE